MEHLAAYRRICGHGCRGCSHAGFSGAGAVLLSGLFFYDIFWVFGTPVMVTVAKSLDAPIKLLFLRAGAAAEPSHNPLNP